MINKEYITYFIKEYLAIIFYVIVIFNILFKVILTKSNKRRKKKRRKKKGGYNVLDFFVNIFYTLICLITFGLSCGFWKENEIKDPLTDFLTTFGIEVDKQENMESLLSPWEGDEI